MIWESESAMDKFKNILKKNVRWVVTGAVIALIMGGAFFGYRAYVQAVSGFIFTVSELSSFSDTAKVSAKVKVDPVLSSIPDEFQDSYSRDNFKWSVTDSDGYPVFKITDTTATPGVAVLEEIGAGASYVTASYYDSFYTNADGNKVTVGSGDDTTGLTFHELSSDAQNSLTMRVPLRMMPYVDSNIMTAANSTFTVKDNAFYITYNAYTHQDSVTSDWLNDFHHVSLS